MKTIEFNSKKSELIELLKKAQELANELFESEKERHDIAYKKSKECDDEKVFIELGAAAINAGHLNCTCNSIKNEIERLERVVMK